MASEGNFDETLVKIYNTYDNMSKKTEYLKKRPKNFI